MQYLHSKDIIHRDLKSMNIFMMKENNAKLGDLGCAKQLSELSEFSVVQEECTSESKDSRKQDSSATKKTTGVAPELE